MLDTRLVLAYVDAWGIDMHVLSARYQSEFLAVPQLVRFTLAQGECGLEPTLLIKSSSLILKYLLTKREFKILLVELDGDHLGYGIEIEDDTDHPAMIWSIAECKDELIAINGIKNNIPCVVHAFNELAINVFWSSINIDLSLVRLSKEIEGLNLSTCTDKKIGRQMQERSEDLFYGRVIDFQGFRVNSPNKIIWQELKTTYVTNRFENSSVSLFDSDEGGQQEILALWLVDNLGPQGAIRGPKVYEPNKPPRELSDLLLTHEYGDFIFESKGLNILSRDSLPSRIKLQNAVSKDICKAVSQLRGGLKNLMRGCVVKDGAGSLIELNRRNPFHSIIVVPDLTLIQPLHQFGGRFLLQNLESTSSFLHFLDLSELLRMVQAAEIISSNSNTINKLMAFDYYLMRRFERAVENISPAFYLLYRPDQS